MRNWKQNILTAFLTALCLLCTTIAPAQEQTSSAQTKETYNVAIIHSYEESNLMADKIRNLLHEEIEKNGIKAHFRHFYLDCEQFDEKEEEERMRGIIDDIIEWEGDIIGVLDDQATYSLMACFHPRTKDLKVVFSGVNYPKTWLLRRYPNITGFYDAPDYMKTLKMMETIMGKQSVKVLGGNAYLDRTYWEDMKNQLKDQPVKIEEWKQLTDLNMPGQSRLSINPELLYQNKDTMQIVHISSDSIPTKGLLWLANKTLRHSVFLYTKRDYTTMGIANLFKNPAFQTINEGFGESQQMMGGYFTIIETQIALMAKSMADRLKGIMPVEQAKQTPKEYVLNWKIMKKYNIDPKNIPAEYRIMYMPFTAKYSKELKAANVSIFIALIVSLIGLFYTLRRERKRKKEALRNLKFEHENMKLAIEGGQGYAWRYDGKNFLFDQAFMTLIENNNNKLSVKEMLAFVHPELRDQLKRNILNVMNTTKHKQEYLMNFTGKYEWWEFRYKVVTTENKKKKLKKTVTGILQNIQENKDREEELIRARKLAEKAELKQSFLTNMSHEIRTPLNAIAGFSNLLISEKDLSEEEKQEFVKIIDNNTNILLKLVGDVLELSRLESGNMNFNLQKINIQALMMPIYQTHRILIKEPIEFICEFPETDCKINVDTMRLTEVITNFLNNAGKFTQSGYIKIGYSVNLVYNKATLYVEDTGSGIDKEEQKMIFTRFYKHDEFAQGAGLGLSLCKHFVEKMGGDIELESEIGKGSRFSVVLPLA